MRNALKWILYVLAMIFISIGLTAIINSNIRQPRGKNYIATKLNRTLEELKVKNWDKITPHNLRHNYCTRGIENKVSLPEMQRLLGHEKISVTDEWYTHLDKEYLKNSAKNVNNNRLSAFRKDKEHITPKRKFFIRRKNRVSTY